MFKRSQKIFDRNIYSFIIAGKSIKSSADIDMELFIACIAEISSQLAD